MRYQTGPKSVKIKEDIRLVILMHWGKEEWRFSFLSTATKRERETHDPLKQVITAKQGEEQFAVSVTPSTCLKQMERETWRRRMGVAEVSCDPLNWSNWLPHLPAWEAAILTWGQKLNDSQGGRHVGSQCEITSSSRNTVNCPEKDIITTYICKCIFLSVYE